MECSLKLTDRKLLIQFPILWLREININIVRQLWNALLPPVFFFWLLLNLIFKLHHHDSDSCLHPQHFQTVCFVSPPKKTNSSLMLLSIWCHSFLTASLCLCVLAKVCFSIMEIQKSNMIHDEGHFFLNPGRMLCYNSTTKYRKIVFTVQDHSLFIKPHTTHEELHGFGRKIKEMKMCPLVFLRIDIDVTQRETHCLRQTYLQLRGNVQNTEAGRGIRHSPTERSLSLNYPQLFLLTLAL